MSRDGWLLTSQEKIRLTDPCHHFAIAAIVMLLLAATHLRGTAAAAA
jgi:hypothetical protein